MPPPHERRPDWGSQRTERMPGRPQPRTERIAPQAPPPAPPHQPQGQEPSRRRKPWLIPAAAAGALALIYLGDLALSSGKMPRGTEVGGIEVGGMSTTAAEQTLRSRLEPEKGKYIPIEAGSVRTKLTPEAAGLHIDWSTTLADADDQPLNPFTRMSSLFGSRRQIDVVTQADNEALSDALDGINSLVRKEPADGTIRFDGLTPKAVSAVPGTNLDNAGATTAILRDWTSGNTVQLPILEVEPAGQVTDAAITTAITDLAKPAVSDDVKVVGEGKEATITPRTIAGALSFAPDGRGGLKPVVDVPAITDAVKPQLASTEQPAKDASVTLVGATPQVTPSSNGRGVDYEKTFAGLAEVLARTDDRTVTAIYGDQPAKLTTDKVEKLGIKGVISKFSTGGFAADSGLNIKRAAETINGRILQPGETFSLNNATGLREAPQGYVAAGIIEDGHPARGVGGGVSQLATTLYNAAYFAGMTDVGHREHSYYISRYPPAREATVFEGAIDLQFRNDLPTGVLIQTVWTPSNITVQFWGTKKFEVTSAPGPKTNPVPQQTLTIPAGEKCSPSPGGPGFTTTDTRTMKDVTTGQSTSKTRTVRYKPSPKVVCAGAEPPPGAEPEPEDHYDADSPEDSEPPG